MKSSGKAFKHSCTSHHALHRLQLTFGVFLTRPSNPLSPPPRPTQINFTWTNGHMKGEKSTHRPFKISFPWPQPTLDDGNWSRRKKATQTTHTDMPRGCEYVPGYGHLIDINDTISSQPSVTLAVGPDCAPFCASDHPWRIPWACSNTESCSPPLPPLLLRLLASGVRLSRPSENRKSHAGYALYQRSSSFSSVIRRAHAVQ
ncbi:hypothetical protein B0O80DRAFT_118893 [Mortierella sp. GBAus27b]|nr:hypothetical protein B0O80DRAFT_118893 [Mortierella sp. GBAus27b]